MVTILKKLFLFSPLPPPLPSPNILQLLCNCRLLESQLQTQKRSHDNEVEGLRGEIQSLKEENNRQQQLLAQNLQLPPEARIEASLQHEITRLTNENLVSQLLIQHYKELCLIWFPRGNANVASMCVWWLYGRSCHLPNRIQGPVVFKFMKQGEIGFSSCFVSLLSFFHTWQNKHHEIRKSRAFLDYVKHWIFPFTFCTSFIASPCIIGTIIIIIQSGWFKAVPPLQNDCFFQNSNYQLLLVGKWSLGGVEEPHLS